MNLVPLSSRTKSTRACLPISRVVTRWRSSGRYRRATSESGRPCSGATRRDRELAMDFARDRSQTPRERLREAWRSYAYRLAGDETTRGALGCGKHHEPRGARERLVLCHPVLFEPGLRHPLLRPGQPCLDHRVFQFVSIEPGKIRDADEHGGVAVPMRRREEDPAVVGEHELLDSDIGDAEDQHVVESFARRWIDRVPTAAAMEAEKLAVHEVRRPA